MRSIAFFCVFILFQGIYAEEPQKNWESLILLSFSALYKDYGSGRFCRCGFNSGSFGSGGDDFKVWELFLI